MSDLRTRLVRASKVAKKRKQQRISPPTDGQAVNQRKLDRRMGKAVDRVQKAVDKYDREHGGGGLKLAKKHMSENMKTFKQYFAEQTKLPKGKTVILKADDDKYDRGLRVKYNADGSYEIQYWVEEPNNVAKIEMLIDGKSIKKDARTVKMLYHPELKKKDEQENSK